MNENEMLDQEKKKEGESIKKGDVVELVPTATYIDGRIIPSKMKEEPWVVDQVEGDQVMLKKSVRGTHAMQEPIHKKYMTKKME